MVLIKLNLNVTINKTLADKNGRYILAETSIDETNIVFVNIYAPNDPSQQILFRRDLSSSVLSAYANENLVLGGDFNCVINAMVKKGGMPFDSKNAALTELESTIWGSQLCGRMEHSKLAQYRFHLEQPVDEDTKQT